VNQVVKRAPRIRRGWDQSLIYAATGSVPYTLGAVAGQALIRHRFDPAYLAIYYALMTLSLTLFARFVGVRERQGATPDKEGQTSA
jgi:hypothetical protein